MSFNSKYQFLIVIVSILLATLLLPTVYLLQQRQYRRGEAEDLLTLEQWGAS